jgi:ADP-ribose pyrophosphatase YjhB (NUDIX family)
VRRKVVAFILRRNTERAVELLLHSFLTNPVLPMRLLGGGVEDEETFEEGLWRELQEETGLRDLRLVRRLGVQRYFKPHIQADVERHDFLLFAPDFTPDYWEFVVAGDGNDAGDTFGLQWVGASDLATVKIDEEHQPFITPDYLPELFAE